MNPQLLIQEKLADVVGDNFFRDNQFFLVFQRKVSLCEKREPAGLEALLRLRRAESEILSIDLLLPAINKMGLLPELTEVVLAQVVEHWEQLQRQGLEYKISINVSASVLNDEQSGSFLISKIKQASMPASQLAVDVVFEEGESVTDLLVDNLSVLRMMGVGLALEVTSEKQLDFEYLEKLPIDEIKLGRALICNILDSESCRKSIRAYISISRKLGLSVTAVGIENKEEERWFKEHGVDWGQGYFYGEPVSVEELNSSTDTNNNPHFESQRPARIKLLVVEDDEAFGRLMTEIFSEHYEFYLTDGEEGALALIEKELPEILILDVNLRSGNGFNIANTIRQRYDDTLFSIIFISGDDSQENHIRAYESGGVAFVAKPVPVVEFLTKVSRYTVLHQTRKEQLQKIADTEAMVIQSMRETSEYGDIIQFMKDIALRSEEPAIAEALFGFMSARGLNCSIVFRDKSVVHSFDLKERVCSPIELNVFDLLKDNGRLYEFGPRLMVNDQRISFLVKNLPDSEVDRGRIRDYVAVLIECMESRYTSILQNRVLKSVVSDLSDLSREAAVSIKDAEQNRLEMAEKFSMEIGMSFHVLSLSLEQESYLKDIVSNLMAEKQGELSTDDIVNRIEVSVKQLSAALEVLNTQPDQDVNDGAGTDTVELF